MYEIFLLCVGAVIGGAIMYFIQPVVKKTTEAGFKLEQNLYDKTGKVVGKTTTTESINLPTTPVPPTPPKV